MPMDLHFAFNLGIALSYYLIPLGLLGLVVNLWTEIAPFRATILKFALFICACATGHLLEAFQVEHRVVIATHGITFIISALVAVQMPAIAREAVRFVHRATTLHRELKASEARFQAFLDCPRLVAWIKDSDCTNIWGNRTMIERFGAQGIGVRDDEWLPAEVADVTLANDRRVLETGQPHEIIEPVPTSDGMLRVWLSYKFLLHIGDAPHVGGIAIEVTEREQLRQELERSNQELEQFAYAASHDLKTPLRGISGLVTILKRKLEDKLNEPEQMILGQIIKDCEYASELVDGILAYSRVGRVQAELTDVDVDELLTEVCDRLHVLFEESGAFIYWDDLPIVRGDRVQLGQVFENLVANAIKYRSEQIPQIVIQVEFTTTHWIFSVQDNGIGIESEYQGQLFTMFKRLHSRSEIEGTGIGLALVRKITRWHGGDAWVESRGIGQGSTFKFSIKR